MVTERIAGINPDDIGRPTGAYRVELLDDRNKVVDRVDSSNYLTPAHDRMVAWSQSIAFHHGLRFVHAGGASPNWPSLDNTAFTSKIGMANLAHPPAFPVEYIVGTDSARAEVVTDEWPTGEVVGYASRWKTGVPASGSRGQINEAASLLTPDTVKLVFDFTADQSNGTIRSLHLGRIGSRAQSQLSMTESGRFVNLNGSASSTVFNPGTDDNASPNPASWASTPFLSENGAWFLDVLNAYLWRYDPADFTTDAYGRTVPGVPKRIVFLASFPTRTTSGSEGLNFIYDNPAGVAVDITNNKLAYVYQDGVANTNVAVHDYTTGALLDRQMAVDSGLTGTQSGWSACGAVIIAGKLYFGGINASQPTLSSSIYSYDLTTFAITSFPLGNTAGGKALSLTQGQFGVDNGNLIVGTNHGIVRMSTAGVLLDMLGDVTYAADETGQAPWSTVASYQRQYGSNNPRDEFAAFAIQATFGSSVPQTDRWRGNDSPYPATRKVFGGAVCCGTYGGKLYGGYPGPSQSSGSLDIVPFAGSMYSRTLLGTPVVKTDANSMRWTYQLTLPSQWRATVPHSTIPAAP